MNDTAQMETRTATESRIGARAWTSWFLPLLALLAGWLLVFNVLRADWATNAQYYYGWFVPLLALGLIRLRWGSRPPADVAVPGFRAALGAAAALVLLLPIRLIEEANPEWRLIQWVHALQMVFSTFCFFYYAGGWPWVRHFAFPVCFLLVAVPWPVPLEQNFVQSLMRVIAGITVELVGIFNIPAVQHGNIIQISSGLVGIDEACSGVRSLQTALFICLFLGELQRFGWRKRLVFVFLGFLVALLANLGRTFYLVWTAFHQGMNRMHVVHDIAGQVVLVFTLAGIWVVSQAIRTKQNSPATSADSPPIRLVPARFAINILAWIVLVELSTEAWYRLHELKAQPNSRWTVDWTGTPVPAQTIKIDDTVTAMLRYNEGQEALWQDGAGNNWQAFFFRWAPGRNSAQLASAHTPDICLRGVGCRLTRDLGLQYLPVNGLNLPFRQYLFERGGLPLHVFYCRWEDQVTGRAGTSQDTGDKLSRLRAVFAGRRHLGQQVLETIVSGPETPAEGLSMFEAQLPRLIRRR